MRAALLRGARDVALVEVPRPEPGPGEVVLRIDAALTCGTDAKVWRRGSHARMLVPPCLIGHEYTGTVAAVGAGVTTVREGDAVVGGNSAPCGACPACRAGREALCDDLLFVNGAFAEWLLVPARIVARNLYARPASLAAVPAAATEPVACVLKGVEVLDARAGESVLLLGSGPIALVFAVELLARGARPVLFARGAAAEGRARRMGVAEIVTAPNLADARDALVAASPCGRGFDAVVEAAGAAETSQAAPGLAAKGGRVLLFGGCAADVRVTWSPARLHYDEIAVLSSFHHTPRHVRAALDALATGRIDVTPLLEAPVGLEGVQDALARMSARELRGKVPVLPGAAGSP